MSDIDRQEAFQRMLLARQGAFANSSSDEFLLELQRQCCLFADEIRTELLKRCARADAAKVAAEECEEP